MKRLLGLFLLACSASAAPAIVQAVHAYPANTFSVPSVTAGDWLVIAYSYNNGTASANCSDSLGLTWTKQQQSSNTAGVAVTLQVWTAHAISGGSDTVTCDTETDRGGTVIEVSGVSGVDTSAQVVALGTTANTNVTWPAVTTASGNAVLALGAVETGCGFSAVNSPFLVTHQDNGHPDVQLQDLSAPGGSIAATGTVACAAQDWTGVELALAASGAAPASPPCTLSTLGAGGCTPPPACTLTTMLGATCTTEVNALISADGIGSVVGYLKLWCSPPLCASPQIIGSSFATGPEVQSTAIVFEALASLKCTAMLPCTPLGTGGAKVQAVPDWAGRTAFVYVGLTSAQFSALGILNTVAIALEK